MGSRTFSAILIQIVNCEILTTLTLATEKKKKDICMRGDQLYVLSFIKFYVVFSKIKKLTEHQLAHSSLLVWCH